jgi:hypothetical protein
MAEWIYKRDPSGKFTALYNDEQLAKFVRLGTVSGAEMVKPSDGNGEWVPVHTLPWYAAAVGAKPGADLEMIALKRHRYRGAKLVGFIVGGYVSVATALGAIAATNANNRPALIAGIVVAAGAGVAALVRRSRSRRQPSALPATPRAEAKADELVEALHTLELELEAAPPAVRARVDVTEIKRAASALREQRAVLATLLAADPRVELEKELAAVREQAKGVSDPSLQDAFSDQVRTIEGRIKSLESARAAAAENEARQRALLHEVCSLRIELGRARVDFSVEDRTLDRLTQLKQQLDDETRIAAELDDSIRAQAVPRAIGPRG